MVSVCLASYNGEKYIRQQLLSILPQLSAEDEIIVSDDGSSDATVDVVKSIGDSRITIILNKGRHGVNGNFQNALENARGEFIFLSDQDDVWLPGKVSICLRELEQCDCIVHDALVTDSDLNTLSDSLFRQINAKPGFLSNLIKNSFTGCCLCIRKSVVEEALPIPNSDKFFYDQWIGLLSERYFKTRFINERLIKFRRHDSITSTAGKESNKSLLEKLSYRVKLLTTLLLHFQNRH